MLRNILITGICWSLISGIANAKEEYEWRYDRAAEGVLYLKNSSHPNPVYSELELVCRKEGSLTVEARGIVIRTDLTTGSPYHYNTLALESAYLRVETRLETVKSASADGWAAARYAGGVMYINSVVDGDFLVVRAVASLRGVDGSYYARGNARLYPSPNRAKSVLFLKYCEKILYSLNH